MKFGSCSSHAKSASAVAAVILFLYDSPCTRITAAVPSVYRDAIRRLTDCGAEVIFRFSGGIPLPDGKGFVPQIKAETNGDDAKA